MGRRWLVGLCAAALVNSGCADKDLTDALLGAGVAVVSAVVYAAASGECWGQCSHGYQCDRDRGVCVPQIDNASSGPIVLASVDEGCIVEDDGSLLCPDDPITEHDPVHPSTPLPQHYGACDDLCYGHERCRIIDNMAYCVGVDDPLYDD